MKAIFTALFILAHPAIGAQFAPLFQSAERAMQDSLWDVAAIRLGQAVTADDATPGMLQTSQLMLGECLVRGNRPDEALEVLGRPLVREDPSAPFWIGQALAGKGKFGEAVEILLKLASDPANPLRSEAAFTTANLQVSLAIPEAALSTLSILKDSPDAGTAVAARLRMAAILIDLGRTAEARGIFPKPESIPESLVRYSNLLEGYLLLSEKKPVEAQPLFATLLGDPTGQSLSRYNLAALGMADSIAAQGDKAAAIESLFAFIQSKPETSRLAPMFQRINAWLPDKILSTDQPALVRLAGWLPKLNPPASGFINMDGGTAEAAWPSATTPLTDLEVFAMSTRAEGLRRVNTPLAKAEAQILLQRIQLFAPGHFLAPRSLLTLAKWKIEDGNPAAATELFDNLLENTTSPRIRGEAAFSNAREAYRSGNPKLAASLFAEAAGLLEGEDAEAAAFNSALSGIGQDGAAPLTIQDSDPEAGKRLATDLALEKALSSESPEEAKASLDGFLREHPDHPRAREVRLAIAEAALASAPPDLSLAEAQIDTLQASAAEPDARGEPRLELVKLRLLDLSGKTEDTIALAARVAEAFPGSPAASEAALILGKSLFRNGRYNEAQLTLEKLATSEPGTQRAQAALLLAARAAALGATEQSREEALALFDRTMTVDGPLKSLALLEKARLLIDLNRLPTAIKLLRTAYSATTPEDPSRLPTGLLLAEAIYGLGDSDPASISEALEIYDSLVDLTKGNQASYFRLQYLKGLTLEKLPDPTDPTKTRLAEARDAYFSVLDRPTNPPPVEWEWFERSGFRMLTILENTRNWKGAISTAEKIASFGGPRSEEAATRARQLRLKHFAWDD